MMASNKENIPCDDDMMMIDSERPVSLNNLDDAPPQRQLNATEAMVVDGLKQLTKAIFRTQYKSLTESPGKPVAMSPSKLQNGASGGATPVVAMSPSKLRLHAQQMNEAMVAAEKFCSMVVQEIESLDAEGRAHHRQLDVYHSVHKNLFGN